MGEALKKWLKLRKELPVREEVLLNLRVASKLLEHDFEKKISDLGITDAQYNVLRILKGVYPEGHPRCEIITRMIEKAPDITRLIDRLEKQDLVERDRTSEDRRKSITRVTEKGLKIVNEIQPRLDELSRKLTKELTTEECKVLSGLIEKIYGHLI